MKQRNKKRSRESNRKTQGLSRAVMLSLKLITEILKDSNQNDKGLSPVTHKIQMMKNQRETKRRRIKRAK